MGRSETQRPGIPGFYGWQHNFQALLYAPRVFDVIRCSFKHYDAATVAKARLPWLVYFVERPGHISRRYEELQSDTSDEFIWDLTSIFETIDLHSVTSYTIPRDVDDTPLMWSRIENCCRQGKRSLCCSKLWQ